MTASPEPLLLTPPLSVLRSVGVKRGPGVVRWLPDMDLNHDKQIQSLLCYRYTIGQNDGSKLQSLK